MIEKIFNALSNANWSDEDKLTGIRMLLEASLKSHTADDGKIYATAYENAHCLNRKDIHRMSLSQIDEIVDEESCEESDLFLNLLLLKNFATMNWGATSASFSHVNGVGIFEVAYGDKSFKKIFDIELN